MVFKSLAVDDSREERLREYLRCRARVTLLPGGTLSASRPGFFRLCYTAVDIGEVEEAVARIGVALRELGQ